MAAEWRERGRLTPFCALATVTVHVGHLAGICGHVKLHSTTEALTARHDGTKRTKRVERKRSTKARRTDCEHAESADRWRAAARSAMTSVGIGDRTAGGGQWRLETGDSSSAAVAVGWTATHALSPVFASLPALGLAVDVDSGP